MYCGNCGKEVDGNARFCKYCGFVLGEGKKVVSPSTIKNREEAIDNWKGTVEDWRGNLILILLSFLVIIWQGLKPWIKLEVPYIITAKIQWYKVFTTVDKIKNMAKSYGLLGDSMEWLTYYSYCIIPVLIWGFAGISIIYTGYLLIMREKKVKILFASRWALNLSIIASGVSIILLWVVGISLYTQFEESMTISWRAIQPTMANYIVWIVSFLSRRILIPRYEKELDAIL